MIELNTEWMICGDVLPLGPWEASDLLFETGSDSQTTYHQSSTEARAFAASWHQANFKTVPEAEGTINTIYEYTWEWFKVSSIYAELSFADFSGSARRPSVDRRTVNPRNARFNLARVLKTAQSVSRAPPSGVDIFRVGSLLACRPTLATIALVDWPSLIATKGMGVTERGKETHTPPI